MMRRCRVKFDDKPGMFFKNGQSKKQGLNRSIYDADWGELIQKIDCLAAKPGQIVIKVNPKHSSQECRNCGNIDTADCRFMRYTGQSHAPCPMPHAPRQTVRHIAKNCCKSNRDGEKFICVECGHHEHAGIGAAKTIRDRVLELVRGESRVTRH